MSESATGPHEQGKYINILNKNEVANRLLNNPLTEALNKLYEKTTYLDKYGGSVVVAVFTIIGASMYFTYTYLKIIRM